MAALLKALAGTTVLCVAAHTIAEFYRGTSRSAKQNLLARQWHIETVDISAGAGQLAGTLLGRTGGNNSMDALLVAVAARGEFVRILTSDPDDLERLRASLDANEWGDFAIVNIS